MSEGTGSSFLDEIVGGGLNLTTFGLAGFGKEGLKAGVTGKPLVEGTKEITGAAAAEEANELAREQFESDKTRIEKERQEAIKKDAQTQLSLSQGAARARTAKTDTSSSASSATTTTDFLGL